VPLFCGIPQTSVLGPRLFTLYTTQLSSLIHSNKLDNHLYEYYTQVYISLSTSDTDFCLNQLGDCLNGISGWMINNNLRLNAYKTSFIIIRISRQRNKHTHFFPTNILCHSITPSNTLRNLGVTFDSDFNFIKHISLSCLSCFYHIPDLRHIRRYISLSVAKLIATAFITSRLDQCNSLPYNIASKDILKRFSHSVQFWNLFTDYPCCSISHHFQNHLYCLSNPFFWRTFVSIFLVLSSSQANRTPLN